MVDSDLWFTPHLLVSWAFIWERDIKDIHLVTRRKWIYRYRMAYEITEHSPRIIPRGSLSQLLRVRGSKIKKIWWKDSRRGIYMVLCVLWYIVLKHFRGKIKCIFKSSSPSTPKPLTRNCNPEAWTVKGGRSEVQSHSRWHSEFKISLGCMRSCLNKQKLKPQTNTKSFFPPLMSDRNIFKSFEFILWNFIHEYNVFRSYPCPLPTSVLPGPFPNLLLQVMSSC